MLDLLAVKHIGFPMGVSYYKNMTNNTESFVPGPNVPQWQYFLNNYGSYVAVSWVLSFILAIGAAYMAFICNSKSGVAMQLLSTIFAFLFSGLYIIYYFFRYVISGAECFTPIMYMGTSAAYYRNARRNQQIQSQTQQPVQSQTQQRKNNSNRQQKARNTFSSPRRFNQ